MSPQRSRISTRSGGWALLAVLGACTLLGARPARAEERTPRITSYGRSSDGVYDRFDGDLELGVALGAEFATVGRAAPSLRASAHYFTIAGVYAAGRLPAADDSAPALLSFGADLKPLFVPRWAKGFENGPAFFDLTLDSLSVSLGAFFEAHRADVAPARRGFDAQLGLGVPLLARARGPWLEARGALRLPDSGDSERALFVALVWHAFVVTPFSEAP